jgi:hypothetical protein
VGFGLPAGSRPILLNLAKLRLSRAEHRRNLVTGGVDLNALVGRSTQPRGGGLSRRGRDCAASWSVLARGHLSLHLLRRASRGIASQSPTTWAAPCRRSAETIHTASLAVQEHASAEYASVSENRLGQRHTLGDTDALQAIYRK